MAKILTHKSALYIKEFQQKSKAYQLINNIPDFIRMGCVQTKKNVSKKSTLSIQDERKLVYISYQTGKTFINNEGKEFCIIRESTRLVKVPVMKKLKENPLYLRRTAQQSENSIQSKNTL